MRGLKNNRKGKKAVIYTRVSTEEQAVRGYSLIDQEEVLRKEQYAQFECADTNFMRYCNYGISLLSHLDVCYAGASPGVQKKLLGSIFTEKLVLTMEIIELPG